MCCDALSSSTLHLTSPRLPLHPLQGYPYPRLSSSFLFVSGEGGGVIAFRDDWVTNTPAALPAGTSAATPNIGEEEAGLQLEHVLDCPTLDGSMCVRHALETMGWSGAMVAAAAAQPRTPVLSVGSNAAPQQLARKYAAHPGEVILVSRASMPKAYQCTLNLRARGRVQLTTTCPAGRHSLACCSACLWMLIFRTHQHSKYTLRSRVFVTLLHAGGAGHAAWL